MKPFAKRRLHHPGEPSGVSRRVTPRVTRRLTPLGSPGLKRPLLHVGQAFLPAVLLLLLHAAPATAFQHRETNGPATLEARSDTDRTTLALSDVLHIVITVEGGKGLQVVAALRPVAESSWQVLQSAVSKPTPAADGRPRWRQTLTLAPMTPGELQVALTPLVFRDDARGEQRIAFKPFTVTVQSQIKDADLRHARDITSPEQLPAPPEPSPLWWLWLAVPVALVLLLAALWLARRRAAPRPASALRKAMRECDRLAAMRLPERDHARSFVILLTGIVRRYLERRFDLQARRQTTAELLRSLDGRADIDDDAKGWLRDFFTTTDLVKFAGAAADVQRCAALLEQVRAFCRGSPGGGASCDGAGSGQ